MIYELSFPLRGQAPPHDHGYAIYAALCHKAEWLHKPESKILVAPIGGLGPRYEGVLPVPRARLRMRLSPEHLSASLELAGTELQLGSITIKLGMPEISKLSPIPSLQARIVTIKGFQEPEPFLAAARRQLQERGISGSIHLLASPSHGQPWRRVLRVRDKTIVGFSVAVTELEPDSSLKLQQVGLGGRGKMGCGYFVPLPN